MASLSLPLMQKKRKPWSFHTMMLASGPSDLESKSKADIAQLISNEPQLTAWTRNCSYRIVKKAEIEEIAAIKKQARDPNSQSNHAKPSADAQLSPIRLAEAFQVLVAREKNEYMEYQNRPDPVPVQEEQATAPVVTSPRTGTTATSTSKNANEPVSAPPPPKPEFAESTESGAPARIYLLVDYPSNISEVTALLRTGEKGNRAKSGDVPLLPLIDGVLLVVDPTREQRERRKSFTGNTPTGGEITERRRGITTKKIDEKDFGMERANPAASITVYQTANPVIKEFYDAAQFGSLEWSDFIFTELHCCLTSSKEAKGITDLTRELLKTTEKLAADKFAFKEWVSSTRMIPIPSSQDVFTPEQEEQVFTTYTSIIDTVHDKSIHVSTVLYAMKEAVAITKSNPKELAKLPQQLRSSNNQEEELDQFVDFGNTATYRVAKSLAYYQSVPIETRPNDSTKSSSTIVGKAIDEIEREMWALSDLPGVGNQGRKGMPIRASISSVERKVYDTEFATFCSYPLEKVHLTRQLIQCEELLGTPWKGKLRKRDMVEKLDKRILPQRLATVLADFSTVFKEYYAPTDALLLAIYTPTASGRFRTLSWSAKDHVRHRTSFKDWRREKTLPEEYLTPRTMKASGACVPLSSAELSAISEKISVLFPADHSVIHIYQTPRHYNWLSIYHHGDLLGLRPQMHEVSKLSAKAFASHFSASFKDESRIHIYEGIDMPHKPDGLGTVMVANTFNHGLIITSSSDGTILQQYAREDQLRAIVGKGSVLVSYRNGYKYILFPNGDVYEKQSVDSTSKFIKQEEGEIEVTVDPHTNALVEKRSNGVMIVTKSDGARVTYHKDGTRMYTTTSKSHIVVTQPRFADVAIDIGVNLTAKRHAAGEKVAVTKGGLRTRSCIDVSDGTRIEITYDTKVIAKVNGFVRTRKPNGALIIAKDSGEVEYYPSSVLQEHQEKQQQVVAAPGEDASSTLPTNGVYYFDCRTANFQLCDQEQNQFFAEIGDGRGIPRTSVELAGVISPAELDKYGVDPIPAKAVVNDPIEPYVFILDGDGTGREILRPVDFRRFLNELDPFGSEEKAKEIPSRVLSGTSEEKNKQEYETTHTFTKRFQGFGKKVPIFQDKKLQAEIEKLFVPVPTAASVLGDYPAAPFMLPSFTLVRRLQEILPFNDTELNAITDSLASWKNWMDTREKNKDKYKVIDPRDAEMLAQEATLQKKVLAAYKAARAKRKMERQKEKERVKALKEGPKEHMATVQEVDEPQEEEDSDGGLDLYESNESDQESRDDGDVPVDDMDELLWTAFSQADTENTGKLSVVQSRKALVHALGFGVAQSEIINSLKKFNAMEPYMVTFDAFTEIAAYLKAQEEGKDDEDDDSIGISRSQYIAAGSAADAVRSYNLRIGSGSSKNASENPSLVNSSRSVES